MKKHGERREEETRQYQKYSIYEGILWAIFITCVSGFVITGFQKYLVLTASMIGLISSWSYFGQICTPLASLFIEKIGTRKTLTIQSRIGSMLVLNLLLLLAFPLTLPIRFAFFLLAIIPHTVLGSINAGFWYSWWFSAMSDDERIKFSLKRHIITTIVVTATLLLTGLILDNSKDVWGYIIIIGIGSLAGLLSAWPMYYQPETSLRPVEPIDVRKAYKLVAFNPKYRKLARFVMMFFYSSGMTGTFFFFNMIGNLNLSYVECAIWSVLGQLAMFYALKRWSYLVKGFGIKNVVIVCLVISAVVLFLGVRLATAKFKWPIYLVALVEGTFGSVISSFFLNLAYKQADGEDKEQIGVGFNVLMGIGGGFGSITGGFLWDLLARMQLPFLFGTQLRPFDVVTLIACVIRLVSLVPLLAVFEPNTRRLREMLPHVLSTLLFFWKKPEFAEAIEEKKDESTDISKEDE